MLTPINAPYTLANYGSNGLDMKIYYPSNAIKINPNPPYNVIVLNHYPGFVLVHGGGWSGGSPNDVANHAMALAAQGITVGVIEYTLATSTNEPSLPKVMTDISEALTVVGGLDCVQGQPVSLMGVSAGAHLALHFLLTQTNSVHSFIGIATPTDMRPWVDFWDGLSSPVMTYLFGDGFTEQDVEDASPLLANLSGFDTPCVFLQGEDDIYLSLVDAADMHAAMIAAEKDSRFIRFAEGDHVLNNRLGEFAGIAYANVV